MIIEDTGYVLKIYCIGSQWQHRNLQGYFDLSIPLSVADTISV